MHRKGRKPTNEQSKSICWNCVHGSPSQDGKFGCNWSVNYKPVKGWTIDENETDTESFLSPAYTVIDCPFYQEEKQQHRKNVKIEGCERLLAKMISTAMEDYNSAWAKLESMVERKDAYNALETLTEIRSIKEWFDGQCDGIITEETTRMILKHLRAGTTPFGGPCTPENVKTYRSIIKNVTRTVEDIAFEHSDTHMISKLKQTAEKDFRMISIRDRNILCPVCARHVEGKKCLSCFFRWRGVPKDSVGEK